METLLVQIKDEKAYKLLEGLEDLQVIKVLKKSILHDQDLSEKYAGKLPSFVAEEMHKYISKSREEWDDRNI